MMDNRRPLHPGNIITSHCSKHGVTEHLYQPDKLVILQCLKCVNKITDGYNIWDEKCKACGNPMLIIRPGKCVCSECYEKDIV